MEPEKDAEIEIKPVEEQPEGVASAKSGSEVSVTVRLLTQEEFDRREKEKEKEKKEE